MSLKTHVTDAHIEQLERMWNEIAHLQETLGVHEKADLPGISGEDLEWDLGLAMLHVSRAKTRLLDVRKSR